MEEVRQQCSRKNSKWRCPNTAVEGYKLCTNCRGIADRSRERRRLRDPVGWLEERRQSVRRHDAGRPGGMTRQRHPAVPRSEVFRCRSSRCIVCNIPPWLLRRYFSDSRGTMNVGHVRPDGEAVEPMCCKCNRFLGSRALTEKTGREVLRRARRYWSHIRMRDEPWIHTDVDERGRGVGGVDEPAGRQRRLDAFEEERNERSRG